MKISLKFSEFFTETFVEISQNHGIHPLGIMQTTIQTWHQEAQFSNENSKSMEFIAKLCRITTVSAPTIMSIEAKLDKVWRNQPMKFNYREDLILWTPGSGHRGVFPASRNVDDDEQTQSLFSRPYYRSSLWHDMSFVVCLSVCRLWRFVLWRNGTS